MSVPVRENTSGRVRHPEVLRGPLGELSLIDDPLADRLANGDPTLGWEGDDRLCLYVNLKMRRWELWRLEQDGEYRWVVAVPGMVRGHDAVGWLINWMVRHDGRRGFDPHLAVVEHNTRVDRAADAAATERNTEFADRLEHALLRDVGASEVGLSRRQF